MSEQPPALASYFPSRWIVDRAFVARAFALAAGAVGVGVARFGTHRIARYAYPVGVTAFLLSVVFMLGDMSDPARIGGQLVVAFLMMLLAAVCSLGISDSAHTLRRRMST